MSTLRRDWLSWLCIIGFAAVMFMVGCYQLAHAAPPPGSDPNSAIAQWFHSLIVPPGAPAAGGGCCDVADCRSVDYRQNDGGYIILIGKQFGTDIDPHWEPVPPEVILKNKENPLGQPVACYYMGHIRCFIAPPEA